MEIIFKANNNDLLDEVRSLAKDRLNPLERVLAERSSIARLTIEVEKEAKQVTGRTLLFRVSGNLTIEGNKEIYHASVDAEQVDFAFDRMRDDLVREVKKSRGRASRLIRKGGSTLKTFLRFGR